MSSEYASLGDYSRLVRFTGPQGLKMSLYLIQKQRFANLAKFKASVYKILIATDVAAR